MAHELQIDQFVDYDLIRFPYKLGYDCAGTVAEIGARVTRFKVGDEVYVRLPESMRGQSIAMSSNNVTRTLRWRD
jgi:NADPH:quinone reductase-like Zn-dependent oxidoreductase